MVSGRNNNEVLAAECFVLLDGRGRFLFRLAVHNSTSFDNLVDRMSYCTPTRLPWWPRLDTMASQADDRGFKPRLAPREFF